MARKFFFGNTVPSTAAITSRLGAQSAPYKDTEIGKLVKGSTESGHVLCAAGDQISGQIVAVESATADGYGIGSVNRHDRLVVLADGLQATAGTGTIALGDQVVCGTAVAKDTALSTRPKVCKATVQVGTVAASTVAGADTAAAVKVALDLSLVILADQLAKLASGNVWKVVSLGSDGTGAVGSTIVIERAFNFG